MGIVADIIDALTVVLHACVNHRAEYTLTVRQDLRKKDASY